MTMPRPSIKRHKLTPPRGVQLLTYLDLPRQPLGQVMNSNVPRLKEGIKRVVVGDGFRAETPRRFEPCSLFFLLCTSVPLWF